MSNNQSSPSRKLNTVNNKQNTVNDMAIVIPSFAMKFRHGQNYGNVPLTMRQELVDAGVTNTMDAIRKGMRTNTTRWNSSDINQINQLNAGDVVKFADNQGALLARAIPNRTGQVGYNINPQQLTDKYGNAWVDRMSQLEGWDVPTMQRLFDKHGPGSAFQYEYLGEDSPIVLAKAQVQTPQQQTQQTGINLSTGQRNAPMPAHNPKPSSIQFDSPQTEANMRVFNNRDLFPDRQPTTAGSQLIGSSTVQPTVDLMVGQVGQGEPIPVNPVYGTGTPTYFKEAPTADRLNKLDDFLQVAKMAGETYTQRNTPGGITNYDIPSTGINVSDPNQLSNAIKVRSKRLGRGGFAQFPGNNFSDMKAAVDSARTANPDYKVTMAIEDNVPKVYWSRRVDNKEFKPRVNTTEVPMFGEPFMDTHDIKVVPHPLPNFPERKQRMLEYSNPWPVSLAHEDKGNYPSMELMWHKTDDGRSTLWPMTAESTPLSGKRRIEDKPALIGLNETLAEIEARQNSIDDKWGSPHKDVMLNREGKPMTAAEIMDQDLPKVVIAANGDRTIDSATGALDEAYGSPYIVRQQSHSLVPIADQTKIDPTKGLIPGVEVTDKMFINQHYINQQPIPGSNRYMETSITHTPEYQAPAPGTIRKQQLGEVIPTWRTTGQRESLSSSINQIIDATTPNYQNKSTTRPLYEIQQELAQSMPDSDLLSSAPQWTTRTSPMLPSKDVTDRVLNFDERDIVVPPANQVKRESLNEFLGIAPKEGTYNVVSITPKIPHPTKEGVFLQENEVHKALNPGWSVNTPYGDKPLSMGPTFSEVDKVWLKNPKGKMMTEEKSVWLNEQQLGRTTNKDYKGGGGKEIDRSVLQMVGLPEGMDAQDLHNQLAVQANRVDQQWKASTMRDTSGNVMRDDQGFPISASRGMSNLDLAKIESAAQGYQSEVEIINRNLQETYKGVPDYPTQQVMGSINLAGTPGDSLADKVSRLQDLGFEVKQKGDVLNFSGNPDLRSQMELNQFLQSSAKREYLHLPPGYSIAPEYPKQINEMAEKLGRPQVSRNEIVQGSKYEYKLRPRESGNKWESTMVDSGTGTGVKWQGQPIIVDPTVDVPTIQASEDAVIIPKGFDPEFQGLRKQWDVERADIYAKKLGYENTVHKAVVEGAMGVPSLRDRAKMLLEERAQQPMTQPQKPISQPAPQTQSPFGDNEQAVQQVFGTTDIRGALNNLLQSEYGVTAGDKVSSRSRKATPIYHQDQAQQTFDQYGKPIPKRYLAV
ncbi:MAG TPA: hypothetical protein V6D19_05410 [Stenomitos sp.]